MRAEVCAWCGRGLDSLPVRALHALLRLMGAEVRLSHGACEACAEELLEEEEGP